MPNKTYDRVFNDLSYASCLFAAFSIFYTYLAWLVSGGDTWWILDVVHGTNVYYGDDAYRFFLARSAWLDSTLYSYNFMLPAALFLDGVVVWIASGDLFAARLIHGLLTSASLCMLWHAGRSLGISRLSMTLSVIVMALIPRFSFTALSFYGEAWLAIVISLSIWLFAKERFSALAVVASLLPLIRPEGIYFLVCIGVFFFLKRRAILSIVMVLPGSFYFLFLLITIEPFQDYQQWRLELSLILSKIPFNVGKWEIVDAFPPLLLLVSFLGFLYRPIRSFWPFYVPVLLWVALLQILVVQDLAKFEERYLCGMVPVIVLLGGAALASFERSAAGLISSSFLVRFALVAWSVLVGAQGLGSMNALTGALSRLDWSAFAVSSVWGDFKSSFSHHDTAAMQARDMMINKIYDLIEADDGIRLLIIQDPLLYYGLDPRRIPPRVVIGYPATTYMIFHLLLDGQIFVQHSRDRRFSYIRLGEPDYSYGEQRALYVDLMPMSGYPNTWRYDGLLYELYLFSYLESDKPDVDVAKINPISPLVIRKAWEQWGRRNVE